MMPVDGTYVKRTISKNQFIHLIQNAKEIKSSIGYESVKDIVKELTGVDVQVSRGITMVYQPFNVVGLTLDYRVDPKDKGFSNPTVDDYIFFVAFYKDNLDETRDI